MPLPSNNPLTNFLTNQPKANAPVPPSVSPGSPSLPLNIQQQVTNLNNLFKQPSANPGGIPSGGAPSVLKPSPMQSSFPAALPASFTAGAAAGGALTAGLGVAAAGIVAYDLTQLWKLYNLSKPEPKFELIPNTFTPPFEGGQCLCVSYHIRFDWRLEGYPDVPQGNENNYWGSIGGFRVRNDATMGDTIEVYAQDNDGQGGCASTSNWQPVYSVLNQNDKIVNAKIASLEQVAGVPQNCGNITPEQLKNADPSYPTIPTGQNAPFIPSLVPGGSSAYPTIPTGLEAPFIPSLVPGSSLTPGNASQTTPTTVPVPTAPPVPTGFPTIPQTIKFPDGTTVVYAPDGSITFNSPAGNTSTIAPPTTSPTPTTTPSKTPSNSPSKTPSKTPAKTPAEIEADKNNPFILPNVPLFPGAAPGTTPQPNPTQPASSSCQPGSCSGSISAQVNTNGVQGAQNNAATNYWGAMNYALNTQQVNQLNTVAANQATILTRLGSQIPGGGIGGKLTSLFDNVGKLSKWLGIDRILNILVFLSVIHNAAQLSNSLKQTLLEMVANVGDAINIKGVTETADGDAFDLNTYFDKTVEKLFEILLGKDNVDGIKDTWKKHSRIYQAAAQSINAMSSMLSSIGQVVEATASMTGKIGNSLKGAGVIFERSQEWFAEKFDAQKSKFFTRFSTSVAGATEVIELINEVAESVVEGTEAATEFQKANTEFVKAVKDAQKNPAEDNTANKTASDTAKTVSKTATIDDLALIELE